MLTDFDFQIFPFFGSENSASFISYIVHIISINLAWILQSFP
jgi:hypothetical protein